MRGRAALPAVLLLLLPLGCAPLFAGCRSFPGHPVRLSAARLADGVAAPDPGDVGEPAVTPQGDAARAALFLDLDGVWRRITQMHALELPAGQAPRFVRLPEVARSVKKRFAGGGFPGVVRHVVVLGVTGRVPLAPQAMADLMMDPEVERQVLAATTFRRTGVVYDLPGARREHNRVELLGVGIGPIRFNLRFNLVTERRDLEDGRVLLRYDPASEPKGERVTLYRGGALIEPLEGGGARVTELVILGTDIQVAGPFLPPLLNMANDTLRNRATNLWKRAWAGR